MGKITKEMIEQEAALIEKHKPPLNAMQHAQVKAGQDKPMPRMRSKPVKEVRIPIDEFFKFLADCAYDRPSAFNYFCALAGIEEPRELLMHANYHRVFNESEDEVTNEREYLRRIFGGEIPPSLISDNWST